MLLLKATASLSSMEVWTSFRLAGCLPGSLRRCRGGHQVLPAVPSGGASPSKAFPFEVGDRGGEAAALELAARAHLLYDPEQALTAAKEALALRSSAAVEATLAAAKAQLATSQRAEQARALSCRGQSATAYRRRIASTCLSWRGAGGPWCRRCAGRRRRTSSPRRCRTAAASGVASAFGGHLGLKRAMAKLPEPQAIFAYCAPGTLKASQMDTSYLNTTRAAAFSSHEDKDGDGKLVRGEFLRALRSAGACPTAMDFEEICDWAV